MAPYRVTRASMLDDVVHALESGCAEWFDSVDDRRITAGVWGLDKNAFGNAILRHDEWVIAVRRSGGWRDAFPKSPDESLTFREFATRDFTMCELESLRAAVPSLAYHAGVVMGAVVERARAPDSGES